MQISFLSRIFAQISIHMKKTVYFSFILFCCASLKAQPPIYKENAVKYDGITEVRTYHLYNKKENPACNLHINFFFPEMYVNHAERLNRLQSAFVRNFYGGEYAHLSPQKATKAYAKNYEDRYKAAFEKSDIYKEEIRQAIENEKDKNEYAFLYGFEKTMRNTILFNSGNIISQVVNVYEYTGGAHGSSYAKGFVLDMDTGSEITYDDTFIEDREEYLSALLLTYLMDARGCNDRDELFDAGFTFDILRPTANFVATGEGITFIYNPYELGVYILGVVEIVVPYYDLVLFMKPEGKLFRWARNHHQGSRIVYYDLFKYGTEKEIAGLIVSKLPPGYEYDPYKIAPTNDFYMNEEGITFFYDEGVNVLLRYPEINNFIKISWEKLTVGEYWELPVSPTNLPKD